jgi:hypothetical protein
MSRTLRVLYARTDITKVDELAEKHWHEVERLEGKTGEQTRGFRRKHLEETISALSERIQQLRPYVARSIDLYEYFCRKVVQPLLDDQG